MVSAAKDRREGGGRCAFHAATIPPTSDILGCQVVGPSTNWHAIYRWIEDPCSEADLTGIVLSAPGAGDVLANQILGRLGDPLRFNALAAARSFKDVDRARFVDPQIAARYLRLICDAGHRHNSPLKSEEPIGEPTALAARRRSRQEQARTIRPCRDHVRQLATVLR